ARSGKLKGFRYLHLAAHGRDDPRSAYRTALILAPDPERSADPAAFESDGELTAEQIARTWELDAELVVLSACETALGKQAGGEGFLGFAQPLLAKGARGLVLSLWKVDDQATALLMARFYQNLLGKRPGLSQPLPRAEALDEAKRWLRGLTEGEVGPALEALPRGEVGPLATAGAAPPRERAAVEAPAGPRPFGHPYYWAAFILIGDPGCARGGAVAPNPAPGGRGGGLMPRRVARRDGPRARAVLTLLAAAALARAKAADPPATQATPPSGSASEPSPQPK